MTLRASLATVLIVADFCWFVAATPYRPDNSSWVVVAAVERRWQVTSMRLGLASLGLDESRSRCRRDREAWSHLDVAPHRERRGGVGIDAGGFSLGRARGNLQS